MTRLPEMKIPRQRKRRRPTPQTGRQRGNGAACAADAHRPGLFPGSLRSGRQVWEDDPGGRQAFPGGSRAGADGVVGPATWAALDATQAGGDIEEEEPEEMVRLCLTGAAMNALVRAMRDAQAVGGRMRLELDEADYRELMRQIEDEA